MSYQDADFEPVHQGSATDHYLTELELYGYRPSLEDPDPRPLPDDVQVQGAVLEIMDALIGTLDDTALEPDLEDLLWGAVNLFHRSADRLNRDLDGNEVAQRRSQTEQDGSEVRSVELERLIVVGRGLIARRDSLEAMRDQAADLYQSYMRTPWRPKYGSQVNHKTQTSAMVDSRDYLAAKRKASTEVLVPAGPKVVFTGGLECEDHRLIWAKLDRVLQQHLDMVLVHGGSPKGAELIAAKWADHRKVPQVAFKPDWTKHGKSAPFKRNDQMLDVLPIGVIVMNGGSGIQENLAEKARAKGIRVHRIGGGQP
ncbi:DUF2493 domain-containing protein (plasmid) [Asticcacaulis sp. DW145]|uniref:DUF2493 domain-containing protein n=1 Tax=Asticcacaulis sp. DW145 TaxID=3095608 RepID=UPI003088A318|nr:DUF2493 domain-containing protein [Asticcacaulis sp. DW145]